MDYDLFGKYLFEAPDDQPPDVALDDSNPPDIPDEPPVDDGPPDISDTTGDNIDTTDDGPPDISDGIDGDFDNQDSEEEIGNDVNSSIENNLDLDEKISAIMNMNLYQRYLALLNQIAAQLAMMKDSTDILHSVSPESVNIIDSLKKLDENIRLYIKNTFLNENYSKNLLFFNKCLNLLKLLNDIFDKNVKKGLNSMK